MKIKRVGFYPANEMQRSLGRAATRPDRVYGEMRSARATGGDGSAGRPYLASLR